MEGLVSDTPETNTAAFDPFAGQGGEVVDADFSRKLERERDAALEKFDIEATEHMLAINKVCGERDEAIATLREIANASHFDNIGNWARNKAKKALEGAK
jgi:hypothetical protein